MKQSKINKYSDRILKALISDKYVHPILYGTGKRRVSNEVENDFLKSLNIPPEYIYTVTKYLEDYKFIACMGRGGTSGFDEVLKETIRSETVQIKITDPGRIFINSTSFWWEVQKDKVKTWWPLAIAILSLIVTLAFNCYTTLKQSQPTSIEKRIDNLEKKVYKIPS